MKGRRALTLTKSTFTRRLLLPLKQPGRCRWAVCFLRLFSRMRRFVFRRTSGSPCVEAAAGDERDFWCLVWARNNRRQMCAAHQHHVTSSRGADFGANLSICHHTRDDTGAALQYLFPPITIDPSPSEHATSEINTVQNIGLWNGNRINTRPPPEIGHGTGHCLTPLS